MQTIVRPCAEDESVIVTREGKRAGHLLVGHGPVSVGVVQIVGAVLGVLAVHLMFDQPALQVSQTLRTGVALLWSELIATFGLVLVIFGGIRHRPQAVPALVGVYITGAYWFTASTSFANPAVTIARSFSDTFAGISPAHAPMFIVMQLFGALIAAAVAVRLFK